VPLLASPQSDRSAAPWDVEVVIASPADLFIVAIEAPVGRTGEAECGRILTKNGILAGNETRDHSELSFRGFMEFAPCIHKWLALSSNRDSCQWESVFHRPNVKRFCGR